MANFLIWYIFAAPAMVIVWQMDLVDAGVKDNAEITTMERATNTNNSKTSQCPAELSNCQCNATSVECIDTGFTNASFFLSVPHNVQNLVVSGNNLIDLPANLFGACSHNTSGHKYSALKYLDLSNNNIKKIHGKTFHCLPQLETLVLRNNNWKLLDISHTGVFEGLTKLRVLDLDYTFASWSDPQNSEYLIRLPYILNKTSTTLEDLNLSNNDILVLTNETMDMLCNMESLKKLNLSHNYLMEIRLELCTYSIEQLDLSYNSIQIGSFLTQFNQSMPYITDLRLGHNSYSCSCYLKDFYEWLTKNQDKVGDIDNVTCSSYKDLYQGRQVLSLHESDLKCQRRNGVHLETSYIIFAFIACAALIVLYLNRGGIKRVFKRCVAPYITSRTHYSYASVEI